jgi:acetoin utilization protein AcuB
MIVSMWMTRDVVTVEPSTLITDAAALMAVKRIRRLPIVVRHGDSPCLVGIVTASDLYRAFPPHMNPFSIAAHDTYVTNLTVADIMTGHLLTTTPDTPIEEVARVMRDQKIRALPVIHNETLIGLITDSDILRAFVALFESSQGEVRITFDVSKREDLFALLVRLTERRGVRVLSLVSAHQHDRPVCVVRVAGGAIDIFLDELWKSGHHVLHVLRSGTPMSVCPSTDTQPEAIANGKRR